MAEIVERPFAATPYKTGTIAMCISSIAKHEGTAWWWLRHLLQGHHGYRPVVGPAVLTAPPCGSFGPPGPIPVAAALDSGWLVFRTGQLGIANG